MCRLLLVEDDEDYARAVELYLSAHGFGITRAGSAREAIDLAARRRPDLLLVDWMLADGIDGIRLLEALRAIECMPRTVLMTGLLCDDLRADARRLGVAEVVSKPISSEALLEVLRVARLAAEPMAMPSLAVVEVGPMGEMLHVNSRAAQLFERTGLRASPGWFSDLFAPQIVPDLHAAEGRWVAAPPACPSPGNWHIRSQSPRITDSRLVVLLEANEPHYLQQELIHLVLGCKPAVSLIDGRVLIVDTSEAARRLARGMLTSEGVGCCTAEDYGRALHLLEKDAGIRIVIVDADAQTDEVARFVSNVHRVRSTAWVIGAATNAASHCSESSIQHLLTKPWTVTALVELVGEQLVSGP